MRYFVCTGIAYILLSTIALVSALDWNFTPQGQTTPCIKVTWDVTKMELIEFPPSDEGEKKAIDPTSGTVDASSQCGSLLKLNFVDDVSMSLIFLQSNNMVTMDGTLTFIPSKVFGKPEFQNTTATLLLEGNLPLSANDKSFTCNSPITLTFTNATASDNYRLNVEVANTQIQAVGITNGAFSEGVPCQADASNGTVTTEAATTVGPNSTVVTTEPPSSANATTEKPTTEKPTSEKPTTEAPTTAPPSTATKYYYPNATDPCVIVAGDFKLDVTYDKKDNSTGNVLVVVPADVTTGGSCPPQSEISMTWGPAKAMRMVRMKFTTNNDQVEISTISAAFDLDNNTFPDAKDANMTIDFTANMPLSKSTGYYKCKAMVDVSLSDNVKLMMEDVAIQAYNVKGSDFTGEREECAADSPTTVAPVTTPAPVTPVPGSPPTNDYTFPGHCIVLDAGLEFVIPYTMNDDKNSSVTVGIPSNYTTTGMCGNDTQMLNVTFYNDWSMVMYFSDGGSAAMLSDSDSFYLKEMTLTYFLQTDIFKDPKNANTRQDVNGTFESSQFSAKKSGSYECNSELNLGLSKGVTMNSNNLRVKAFSSDNSTSFPSGDLSECPKDSDTNSVVPIAVGAALAGLVIIVLIAYLIGRRRSRSGYQQV